jgi:hypothetical protein
MAGGVDPGFALFVGGFVAVLFFVGAGFLYVTAPDDPLLGGLAAALAGLGLVFLVLGALGAGVLRLLGE